GDVGQCGVWYQPAHEAGGAAPPGETAEVVGGVVGARVFPGADDALRREQCVTQAVADVAEVEDILSAGPRADAGKLAIDLGEGSPQEGDARVGTRLSRVQVAEIDD